MVKPIDHPRDGAGAPAGTPSTGSGEHAAQTSDRVAPCDRPFVEDYLPALLGQAAQRIQGEFHRVVRAHGFAVSEWRVLATLADGTAMTTGQLAQVSLTKGPTATRLLDRMVARGEVERLPDLDDRRVTRVRITDQGQRTVSALIVLARAHEGRVLSQFGWSQTMALKAMLREMIAAPAAWPDPQSAEGAASDEDSSAEGDLLP